MTIDPVTTMTRTILKRFMILPLLRSGPVVARHECVNGTKREGLPFGGLPDASSHSARVVHSCQTMLKGGSPRVVGAESVAGARAIAAAASGPGDVVDVTALLPSFEEFFEMEQGGLFGALRLITGN